MDHSTLSNSDLIKKATDHDEIYNEGGEGYNPYRTEIDRRYRETQASQPRTRYDILTDLERYDSSIARESGTHDTAKVASLNAELATLDNAKAAEYEAKGWTAEATRTRRAEWNGRVKAGQFGNPVSPVKVKAQEEAQGWAMAELREAVKLHCASSPVRGGCNET